MHHHRLDGRRYRRYRLRQGQSIHLCPNRCICLNTIPCDQQGTNLPHPYAIVVIVFVLICVMATIVIVVGRWRTDPSVGSSTEIVLIDDAVIVIVIVFVVSLHPSWSPSVVGDDFHLRSHQYPKDNGRTHLDAVPVLIIPALNDHLVVAVSWTAETATICAGCYRV